MSRIRILPENLANQIAAGEVVERPASVVKELIENAIDAGAANLSIQIGGGGTSLIRVIDDGIGMDEDDILLSLERHATSKIVAAEDLDYIKSLGFRGEAVPSIASVSRMSITSRTQDSTLGCRVEVRFGKVMKVHEMGCQLGTVVEVRDLFGNVPARKKFLKTTRTELAHIEDIIKNYGLVRPDISLNYSVNGRETLLLPAGEKGGISSRFKTIFGLSGKQVLLDLENVEAEFEVTVSGFILPPDQPHSPATKLRGFVNGRPVKDRMITHAVAEGMRNFLMKGRYPAGIIYLDLPANTIDVNVHPTKQEVRFHKGAQVHRDIVSAVSGSLLKYQDGLKQSVFGNVSVSSVDSVKDSTLRGDECARQQEGDVNKISRDLPPPVCDKMPEAVNAPKLSEPVLEFMSTSPVTHDSRPVRQMSETFQKGNSESVGKFRDGGQPESTGNLKIIGQLFDSFILCEGNDGLVAIDQHAAQERLIFEKLKAQLNKGRLASQSLMFPKTLELGAEDIAVIETDADEIARLGVDIGEFGGSTYVLKAVPAVMAHLPPEEILSGILQQISAGGTEKRGRDFDTVLAGMACKAAIKANHNLRSAELESLLMEMQENDIFSHCPHGRPVVRVISENEVRKWFHRT